MNLSSSTSVPHEQPVLPEIGGVFVGKYRIERVLGRGGMGIVYAARHLSLDEKVAIKVLLPDASRDPETIARFVREGRTAVRIRSEHVVRVLDVGTASASGAGTAEPGAGTPYIVMEYLEGEDLREMLAREGPFPVAKAVEYVLQAGEALAEVHAMRAVHRDLKPANLFRVRRPDGTDCVKVLDFGISKLAVLDDMTKSSSTMGTPRYMSPEQLRSSRDVDARSDIWSLGVVLFELIAGKPPFAASTVAELGAMVLTGQAPTLKSVVPDVPAGLSNAIARCLRRDPTERFPTIAELASEIARYGGEEALSSARSIANILVSTPRPAATPAAAVDKPKATGRASLKRWIALGALGISVLGLLGGVAIGRYRTTANTSQSRTPTSFVSSSAASPSATSEASATAAPAESDAPLSSVASSTSPSSSPPPTPRARRPMAGAATAPRAAPSPTTSTVASPTSKPTGELTHDRHN